MPDFQKDFFFTPPQVAPLGLDLAELRGGGWAPAQFYGNTQDDRDVYCRYRGGWLSITISDAPFGDALRDGVDVLSVGLGPPFHGGLSLHQLCTIAGMTINGELPEEEEPCDEFGTLAYRDKPESLVRCLSLRSNAKSDE